MICECDNNKYFGKYFQNPTGKLCYDDGINLNLRPRFEVCQPSIGKILSGDTGFLGRVFYDTETKKEVNINIEEEARNLISRFYDILDHIGKDNCQE